MSAVPKLPVFRPGQKDFPEWRAYLRWVYGDDATEDVDLNAFSWFYWRCPLGALQKPVPHDSSEALPPHTAWICEQKLAPEYRFKAYGFFVTQPASVDDVRRLLLKERLEVLRVRFPETGVSWFYATVGSGVFLNLDALPSSGSMVVHKGLPDDWRGGVLDSTASAWMQDHDCAMLVVTERFADSRVEIIVRSPKNDSSRDMACPFTTAAFSSGFSKTPCDCNADGTYLLNCRREVWQYLKTRGAPAVGIDWVYTLLESAPLLGACVYFVMVCIAVLLQSFHK